MARIKVQEVIDHMASQFRSALEAAVNEAVDDDGSFDRYELYRAFRRAVGRKCSTWERVPDRYIDMG